MHLTSVCHCQQNYLTELGRLGRSLLAESGILTPVADNVSSSSDAYSLRCAVLKPGTRGDGRSRNAWL